MAPFSLVVLLCIATSVFGKVVVDNDDFTIWTIPDNAVDISGIKTTPGTGLIGGSTNCDEAFAWQIDHANNGDFVILRASETDEFNLYVYDLSVSTNRTLNSVTTVLFKNGNGSTNKQILTLLKNAEAIFFAGGDQNNYLTYWGNTPVQAIVQEKLKTVTTAGTSAGLAIQGNWIFSAEKDSAYSAASLMDPYNEFVTIADKMFRIPYLETVITDTHFTAQDRMGRLLAFMARITTDNQGVNEVRGMGIDEETALLLDHSTGEVTAVGKNYAFLCYGVKPSVCSPATPLTYKDIHCDKLSGAAHDKYSMASFSGQGRKYDINVLEGLFSADTVPYGPV